MIKWLKIISVDLFISISSLIIHTEQCTKIHRNQQQQQQKHSSSSCIRFLPILRVKRTIKCRLWKWICPAIFLCQSKIVIVVFTCKCHRYWFCPIGICYFFSSKFLLIDLKSPNNLISCRCHVDFFCWSSKLDLKEMKKIEGGKKSLNSP